MVFSGLSVSHWENLMARSYSQPVAFRCLQGLEQQRYNAQAQATSAPLLRGRQRRYRLF